MKKFTRKTTGQIILLVTFAVFSFFTIQAQDTTQNQSRDIPTYLRGTLTNCYSGEPLANVKVHAFAGDTFATETNTAGFYKMLVVPDTFELVYSKAGFRPDSLFGVVALRGVQTEAGMALCKIPYPPAWVFLMPDSSDTQATVSWTQPNPDYEIIYDDGSAEEYAAWVLAGGRTAVRFTPAGYPATVKGGRIYVGDGSFPEGSDFIGTDFAVGILDDDGPDGFPGTVLDSVTVTVNNYGWVSFDDVFNLTFQEGDFYMVMWQLGVPPDVAPVGIDTDLPTVYRSYAAMAGTDWIVSSYQDFMMRATVGSPNDNLLAGLSPGRFIIPPRPPLPVYIATGRPEGMAGTVKDGTFKPLRNTTERGGIAGYNLAWVDGFEPDSSQTPAEGVLHIFPGNPASPFTDTTWGARPPGFYAYAVRTIYENDTSVWAYSNIAAHLMDNKVEISVNLCDDSIPENVEVLLVGKQYPYQLLEGMATLNPETGLAVMVFDSVIDGTYDLTVYKIGYKGYFHFDLEVLDDYSEFVTLEGKLFPANNLYVDSLTSVATWETAWITQLALEDFEGEKFPPEGWQKKKGMGEIGWYRANSADFGFTVPPGDGYYAVVNSYMIGSGPYETDNYLIMPKMDLRQSPDYKLYFDHFFTGAFGETAQIKYSTDTGITWENYYDITPISNWSWNRVEVDLSPLSGPEGLNKVWLALYYSDNRNWAQGWTVDNVSVHNGPAPVLGYYVYLNDSLVAETAPEVTSHTYTGIIYGRQYKSTVRANYNCGLSDPVDYFWTSGLLFLPRNLGNTYSFESDEVPLHWLPPVNEDMDIPQGLLRFNIYRDSLWVAAVDYNGQGVDDTIRFTDSGLDPACYTFTVTAVYDLGVFGFPGQEGETTPAGPDSLCVLWGYRLPFFEDWNEGSFAFNGWRLDGKAWTISSSTGMPEPSAEFNSDMLIGITDYSSSLTSNPFVCTDLSEGDILVEFNTRLESINATGKEKLLLEISTDAGKTWDSVAGFSNAEGSFGFQDGFRQVNITDNAMGNIFHLRFRATGKNAADFQSWFVDNIHIYRTCPAPADLAGTYFWTADEWGVRLDWRVPEAIDSAVQWIFWDNENHAGGFGFGSSINWSVAQRWDAGQLKDWNGEDLSNYKITKISFILNDNNFSGIYLRIWSGEHAGTQLHQQSVKDPVIGEWMEVQLNEAVAFNIDSALWIGYSINGQPTGGYPAGYDQGPAVSGYGDMLYVQGKWWLSSQLGLNNNWAIHAFLEKLPAASANTGPEEEEGNRSFSGFKLYRQQAGIDDDYVLYDILPWQQGQLAYTYFDYAPAVDENQTYFYQVTANWAGETDTCESEPGLTTEGTEDYVSILVTELPETEATALTIFPNPASDRLHVSSTAQIKQITIFNAVGQVVIDEGPGGENAITLKTASLEPGIYVVCINTAEGLISRRLIISR